MLIEPLNRRHDRQSFDCGQASLNLYLLRLAHQNADRDIGLTFVAVEDEVATVIAGFYTLSGRILLPPAAPGEKLPPQGVHTALLARLAVSLEYQGRGLGRFLLFDALRRVLVASEQLAIYAVDVDALDERARDFYLKYGFTPALDNPLRLFLPLKTLRPMFSLSISQ